MKNVVILGGNECMECRYRDVCKAYKCRAKIFTKPSGNLRSKIGKPDMIILFTGTVSHKMVEVAAAEGDGNTIIEYCHSSSISALKKVLDKYRDAEEQAG